jgi:hypothetical protein
MTAFKYGLVILSICTLILGCAPKRLPEGEGENIPLSQVLTKTLTRYEGINTLQAQLFVQLDLRDEFYVLRGILICEKPSRLRLRLTTSMGGTVGELIYDEGLILIILPTEGRIYRGWIEEGDHSHVEALFLTMVYSEYVENEGRRFPTRIYGEAEGLNIRFDMRLKDPQVDLLLPEGAFIPPTGEWEIHPLADLQKLLQIRGGE